MAVALGADPATILGAVTPVPDSCPEYQFAGLLRGAAPGGGTPASATAAGAGQRRVRAGGPHPAGPARADHTRLARAGGPFGDHTGYYNGQAWFPVFTSSASRCWRDRSTTRPTPGKPPDEPAVLGVALNGLFVPMLQRQFPEITDFYLPPEGCSYRMALVRIARPTAGPPRR